MDKQVETTDITRPAKERSASGKPGKKPTWSSGAKTLVGTAASSRSRVWFTVGLGTLNEIYFADVEQANTRSARFLVSDGSEFFSDEASDCEHVVSSEAGVPCCKVESRCKQGRYVIVKEIIADPVHNTVLMRTQFTPKEGCDLKLYLTVDPHIGDKGDCNKRMGRTIQGTSYTHRGTWRGGPGRRVYRAGSGRELRLRGQVRRVHATFASKVVV